MDKDKFAVSHDPCSWLEMHQFIGDLMVTGGALGLKDAPPAGPGSTPGSAQPRQVQAQAESIREARDISGQTQHHTCTCPGCPYSSSSSSFQTIKPSSTYSPELSQPQSQAKETSTQSPSLAPTTLTTQGTSSPSPLPQIPTFPCFCCRRGFQTCTQLQHHQQGAADFPSSQTHTYYHHHCPLTICLPHHHSHPGLSPGTFPCLSCQHSFPSCSQLFHEHQGHTPPQNHVGGVTIVSPTLHPCMHCPASFPRPSQLLQHQRTQHAHKAGGFLCTECGRAFNSHSNLRIHLNVHTGARPYSCPDCGKSFSQSGALKIHRRIHTGERPYTCTYCGRGFPHLAGVRAHQRTHTGSGLTVTSDKELQFQSSSVKIPSRRAEPGSSREGRAQLYTCEDCGLLFRDAPSRNRHQTVVHYSTEGVEEEGLGDTGGEG
ncbi:zinc finger protein 501-like isoform X2 [Oncorhynchus tshawytscha]|uniref:C2H2-type domain-containing protein n=1 Tax=Oncorhynchus tshawytscha TaxID=74940 RepID=A0AAZ3Q0P1_ONCTS|nr:zinc finger protein 501-like isoform X2 [Oncorhynchus tshawytscha]